MQHWLLTSFIILKSWNQCLILFGPDVKENSNFLFWFYNKELACSGNFSPFRAFDCPCSDTLKLICALDFRIIENLDKDNCLKRQEDNRWEGESDGFNKEFFLERNNNYNNIDNNNDDNSSIWTSENSCRNT